MRNRTVNFSFDMGRKNYLEKMVDYGWRNKDATDAAIKNNKIYFERYYGISLDAYVNDDKKFIIPYEMSDLYCLMMHTMKDAPTYSKKGNPFSLQEIIEHNKKLIGCLDILPPQIADYIKMTPEYHNTVYLINYFPVIIERVSAILYRILDTSDTPIRHIIEYLIDGLDDTYERLFWEKSNKDKLFDWISKNKDTLKLTMMNIDNIPTSKSYHLLDFMLANFFSRLDRSNWPKGTHETASKLLTRWEDKHKNEADKDAKIKNEFLCWLLTNEWHELHKLIQVPSSYSPDELVKSRISDYNARYDKKATIHPLYLRDKESEKSGKQDNNAGEVILEELSQIKISLQNAVDIRIIQELSVYKSNIVMIKEVFQKPLAKHLSGNIFSFIFELLDNDSKDSSACLLSLYLDGTLELLDRFDSKYKRFGLEEYVDELLNGSKSMDNCCNTIYADIYVKIQSQKCDQFNTDKDAYKNFYDGIINIGGEALVDILKKEFP